ncbi:MAG: GDSL-type esterase/lipase family protein [Nocardioides sp.]
MNTDPRALRVLCFGDSGTYGTCLRDSTTHSDSEGLPTPDPDYVRLDVDHRWPGVLQRLLGGGYDVLEEGLNGRTTDLDDAHRPGLNGRGYFVPCLLSHNPLEVVVVQLGGNDLKPAYVRSPRQVAEALGRYVDDVATYGANGAGRTPKTVLVGHIRIDDTAPRHREMVGDSYDPGNAERFRELDRQIRAVAAECGASYVDAASVARPGNDGVHFDQPSHTRLAELLASTIRGQG